MISMSRIRFVEPEIISTLKDELERRLGGAVGGIDGVLGAIGNVNLAARRRMLEELTRKQPELAAEVRRHILMPEDLALFADRDLSLVVSANKLEDWTTALFGLPDNVKQKIKGQMADRTWQMVEQSMSYIALSQEKSEEAAERIMGIALGMIKEGKIANPLEAPDAVAAGKRPAPGAETGDLENKKISMPGKPGTMAL
jgi:flagellar motor switch protein FliG